MKRDLPTAREPGEAGLAPSPAGGRSGWGPHHVQAEAAPPPPQPAPSGAGGATRLIALRDVGVRFGAVQALQGVNLQIAPGESVAFIGGIALIACALWLWNPGQFASPLFHLFSGGAMLGAFFIVTDPVSGCTTPKGKLIFGFAAGVLAYLIRVFGGYPDGVAFAVLLLNICVPLIDMRTQRPVFGRKTGKNPDGRQP